VSGKCNRTPTPDISVRGGGGIITSQVDVASTLAFSTVCTSDNSDPSFRQVADNAETLPQKFILKHHVVVFD
jgi:hypothetical protein